ncbi:hypothetical protein [Guggenheimella bovis]
MSNESDIKDLAEILDTVTDKVPRLLREVMGTLYSPEAGANIGKSVGGLYKELVNSGIPEKDALEMAKSYIISLKDIKSMEIK